MSLSCILQIHHPFSLDGFCIKMPNPNHAVLEVILAYTLRGAFSVARFDRFWAMREPL